MLKKILAIACTLIMLCGMTAFALEADTTLEPEPIVSNGDFEEALSWDNWGVPQNGKGGISTEYKHGGNQSVNFYKNADKTFGFLKRNVPYNFIAGQQYVFEAWYYNPAVGETSAQGKIFVYAGKDDANMTEQKSLAYLLITPGAASDGWKKFKHTFVAPEGMDNLRIALCAYTDEVPIYFDDIKIYEAPLIVNGDFEDGNPVGYANSGGTKIQRVEGAGAHSGNACLKFDKSTAYWNFPVACKENTTYKLSYWFKYDTAAGWPVLAVATGYSTPYHLDKRTGATFASTIGGVNTVGIYLNQGEWVKRTHYFSAPNGENPDDNNETVNLNVILWGPNTNSCVYYDDFNLEVAKTEVELHNYPLDNGTDITDLSACGGKTLYIKGRFIAEKPTDTAMLITVIFDESKGKKQLEYLDIKPVTGTQTLIDSRISGYASFEGKAVEAYIWDSTTGLDALAKKVRRSQSATQ